MKRQREPTVLGLAHSISYSKARTSHFVRWLSAISPWGFAAVGSLPSTGVTCFGTTSHFSREEASLLV